MPIFRAHRDFMRGVAECSRTQFPATIAYAITVHKSHGATLESAVVDISGREFQTGLSYVAVSRVKTLQGLMFEAPFDLDAIRAKPGNKTVIDRAKAMLLRRDQYLQPAPAAAPVVGPAEPPSSA